MNNDIYQMLADEFGVARAEIKRRVMMAAYGDPEARAEALRHKRFTMTKAYVSEAE
jgi:hypothetical protein